MLKPWTQLTARGNCGVPALVADSKLVDFSAVEGQRCGAGDAFVGVHRGDADYPGICISVDADGAGGTILSPEPLPFTSVSQKYIG